MAGQARRARCHAPPGAPSSDCAAAIWNPQGETKPRLVDEALYGQAYQSCRPHKRGTMNALAFGLDLRRQPRGAAARPQEWRRPPGKIHRLHRREAGQARDLCRRLSRLADQSGARSMRWTSSWSTGGRVLAIAAKPTPRPAAEDVRGLRAFLRGSPPAAGLLVHGGPERRQMDRRIWAPPWTDPARGR